MLNYGPIASLAAPLAIDSVVRLFTVTMTTSLLAAYSSQSLANLTIANLPLLLLYSIFESLAQGGGTAIARSQGSTSPLSPSLLKLALVQLSLAWGIAAGLATASLAMGAPWLLSTVPEIGREVRAYWLCSSLTMPLVSCQYGLSAVATIEGRGRWCATSSALVSAVFLLGLAALVTGFTPALMPDLLWLGLMHGLSRLAGVLVLASPMLASLWQRRRRQRGLRTEHHVLALGRVSLGEMWSLLRQTAVPLAAENLVNNMSNLALTLIANTAGSSVVAARACANVLFSVLELPFVATARAVQFLVAAESHQIFAKHRGAYWRGVAPLFLALAGILWAGRFWIMSFFAPDKLLGAMVLQAVPLLIAGSGLRLFTRLEGSLLRARGHGSSVFLMTSLSLTIGTILPCLLMVWTNKLDLPKIFLFHLTGEVFLLALLRRASHGHSVHVTRIGMVDAEGRML